MTNNLAKIAKDLRAFAKRCKDVHYSDSLLISFILSGILSLASISFSDTFDNLSDSQKEAAMDSINEMRQQINYARKDNDKLIKGSSLELVKLMEQGDQVVKSPWGSQQFGFGYTYNSWGTSFKGRGGKQNDIKYRRTNDLTKYVFDPNLHEYGATNLHIKRNKEPDVLVINPANVHKSYTPPTVTRMDAMTMIDGPQFNPNVVQPTADYYNRYNSIRLDTRNVNSPTTTNLNYDATTNNNTTNSYLNTNNVGNNTGTFVASNGQFFDTYGYNATGTSTRDTSSSTNIPGKSGFSTISGEFYSGGRNNHFSDNGSWPYYALNNSYYAFVYVDFDPNDDTTISKLDSGYHGHDETWKKLDVPNGTVQIFNTVRGASVLADKNLTVKNSKFIIARDAGGDGTRRNAGEFNNHNGINVIGGNTLTVNGNSGHQDYYSYLRDANGALLQYSSAAAAQNSGKYVLGTDQIRQHGSNYYIVRRYERSGVSFDIQNGVNNNGILSSSTALTDVSHTGFTVSGNYNNGINMLSTGNLNLSHSNFVINNTYNTGVSINGGATSNNIDNTSFNLTGNHGTGIGIWSGTVSDANTNTFTLSGQNDGIYINNGTTLTKEQSNIFNVNGNNSNGIFANTGSNLAKSSGSTFKVLGNNSNGILKTTSNNTIVENGTFTVSGSGSTGITYNGGSSSESVSGSTFTVNGGPSSAGIHMVSATALTIDPKTTFTVSSSSIGIELENNGIQKKTVTFNGGGSSTYTDMILSGDKNIAVNIHGGIMNETSDTNKEITLTKGTGKKGLDITIQGNQNIGYNNLGYVKSLTIDNGDDPIALNSLDGHGRIKIGTYTPGTGTTGHNSNVIFANQGYVEGGSIKLKQIEVDGNNNTIAYFAKGNGNYSTAGYHPTNNAGVGFFNGNVLELQGVMGVSDITNNNTVVYASSGQRSGMGTTGIIGQDTNVTLGNLKVTNLNVGVGPKGSNNTLVYADKGTVVEVANNTTATNGALIADTISDGETYSADGTTSINNWGYWVPYNRLSKRTTIAYSTGTFNNSDHNFLNNFTAYQELPTEIKINSPVDMVSKEGTAYHVTNGGKITVGSSSGSKATRAGGYKSIIAYAEDGRTSQKQLDDKYLSMDEGPNTHIQGSSVVIYGNVTAADNSLFSTNVTLQDTADRQYTYQNIGGYATGGADIIFNNTSVKSGTNKNTIEESDKALSTGGSLIYGLGAYASGQGSKVVFNKDTNSKATIVTGTKGALFAEDNGYIEFAGNVVHQNNALPGISTGATADGAGITPTAETRLGTGLGGNDHSDIPVFYVRRTNKTDKAGIVFNDTTKIDMYDGIFLTGDQYYHRDTVSQANGSENDWNLGYSDYYGKADNTAASTDHDKWRNAKYRGMEKVTLNLVAGSGDLNLGLINQSEKQLEWDNNQDKGSGQYLKTIGTYAGGATINNSATSNTKSTSTATKFASSLINDELKITTNVELEDYSVSNSRSGAKSALATGSPTGPADTAVDPFNNIKMESTLVTIESGKNVYGDLYFKAGQGLNMANSLYRWDTEKVKKGQQSSMTIADWRKTNNEESGYVNSGTVSVWGGVDSSGNPDPITGMNVVYGTIYNKDSGKVYLDHGAAIVGTDDSILKNEGTVVVTGKYDPVGQDGTSGTGVSSSAKVRNGLTAETKPSGENYGIIGISTNNARENATYGGYRYGNNKVTISNIGKGTIEVDGDLAVGIFAKNVNQNGGSGYVDVNGHTVANVNDKAEKDNISITYDNQKAASPDAIKVNYGAGATGGTQTVKENKALRGVGIALVEHDKDRTAANRGGIITLNTQNKGIANTADILTFENGIGIYGESADIRFKGDSTGLTVDTGSDGAGVWVTDDSNISSHADRIAGAKTLNYNYKGYDNKKGFAMVFGSTDSNNAYGGTNATNYMDIKFNNNSDAGVTLAVEKAKTAPGAAAPVNTSGTYKGIAGILVNTDKGRLDTVTNYGDIKEDKSKTHVRSYGAVVNSGNFVNWGNIELSDSLLSDAANVEKNDLKKVNVGILANDHENGRANTYIESHGDIKVGTTSNQNVGGFGIYGYNVTTGPKADGSESTITINRNSYGIYSGDGTVNIQKGTKLLVGNDTVLGHEQTTKGTSSAAGAYPINRQTAYTAATDLLPGRTTDAAVGVYIGSNENLSKQNRNVDVSANMDIDRYSYGIVLAENNGGATTNVTIGSPTYSPTINLASNTKAGGQVKSHVPTNPAIPEEVYEQGNAVYYYSADKNSKGTTYANITMNGDYNTAYRTAGSIDNHGIIDLRSQWDIANPTVDKTTGETINLGYGNLGIVSENPDIASTNYGKIITGMSDTQNMRYSAAMAAGRNVYDSNNTFVKTEADGYVINRGNIVVQAKDGIGMFATGSRSRAINYGNIELIGDNSTGMYLDRGAIGENYGTIEGSANNLRGVVAINGGYIKNYGTINVTGQNSNGIVTDSSRFIVDANGNPVKILSPTDAQYDSSQATTAGQNNGKDGSKDLYGGKESSIAEYTSGNPKTTGVGTTIAMPSVVPMTTITVDGVNTPIFTVDTDAATQGQWGEKISITSSIQTGGTRIIDLSQLDGWGNKMWNNYHTDQLSEVTSIGMYVDTSGVKYSNPINGIQNLKNLGEVNLYFGSEATLYTNAKAIRLGTNILKPFNDSLTNLPGGAVVNPLSASLTWQVAAKLDDKNQLTDVYMSKVPYHSFAYDDDTSLVNFTNNLDNVYEIVDLHTNEKEIFNKLNSLGNGEGHILAQAFDQMRAHIYGGIQQRTVATEKIFDSQVSGVMSSNGMVGNPSKDSTKYKAFGERGEYKTDTKGIPDYENYAGGFVAVHEGESIYKGEKHGWYTGVVDNNFSFKDIARSHENQAMIKGGLFKTTPFDVNGEFTWTIAGEGYFGRTDTNRRFWVVDKQYDAEAHYYTYGVALKNELAKSFRLSEGFAIKPHVGIDLEYGRYSSFHEDGTMSLDVKGNDYHSIKPNLGVDFTYKQPVFKKSMFVASLGLGYEKELGRVNDVTNEARIQGAWTDYFSIRGDKENKKGNYKADLNLGIDNGRLGFTVNAGYDSTGKNFRGGAGLRFIF